MDQDFWNLCNPIRHGIGHSLVCSWARPPTPRIFRHSFPGSGPDENKVTSQHQQPAIWSSLKAIAEHFSDRRRAFRVCCKPMDWRTQHNSFGGEDGRASERFQYSTDVDELLSSSTWIDGSHVRHARLSYGDMLMITRSNSPLSCHKIWNFRSSSRKPPSIPIWACPTVARSIHRYSKARSL